jgi:hypothetical protein
LYILFSNFLFANYGQVPGRLRDIKLLCLNQEILTVPATRMGGQGGLTSAATPNGFSRAVVRLHESAAEINSLIRSGGDIEAFPILQPAGLRKGINWCG